VLRSEGILSATDLLQHPSNNPVRIAGCVIARQRPGTAKGFVFLSLEDETGIANVILTPDVFERDRMVVKHLSAKLDVRSRVGLPPRLRQTVKTRFAVRCKVLDRQDHSIAF
jgi:DNA polymerase III alpha subunit